MMLHFANANQVNGKIYAFIPLGRTKACNRSQIEASLFSFYFFVLPLKQLCYIERY